LNQNELYGELPDALIVAKAMYETAGKAQKRFQKMIQYKARPQSKRKSIKVLTQIR